MPRPRPQQRTGPLSIALMLAAAIGAWVLAGPAPLGGFNTYLITSGISMLPNFHTGDFVVARKAGSYHVGDIVAYHWQRTIVLHRIVAEDNGHFVMKGDHNTWYDPVEPSPEDVAGKLWIHVPAGGKLLSLVRQPALLFGLLAAAVGAMVARSKDSPRRRRGKRTMSTGNEPAMQPTSGINQDTLAVAVVAVLASLVFVVFVFSRPLTKPVQTSVPYQQSGAFSYSAQASGSIYEDGQVQTGDQIYFRLVRALDLAFDYQFSSAAPHRISGTYQLLVEVGEGSGLKRTTELVPTTPFAGDHVSIGSGLDLYALQALMNNFAYETGSRDPAFTLAVEPVVRIQGDVAGQPIADQFMPKLAFKLNQSEMLLSRPVDAGNLPSPAAGPSDGLKPAKPGSVSRQRPAINSLSLPFVHPSVLQAQIAGLISLLVSVLATAAIGILLREAHKADEPARLRARYGAMLLDVHGVAEAVPKGRIVDLLRPGDLAKIAEREGRMILHSNGSETHQYMVSDGEIVYRYLARSVAARPEERDA